jgi:hypothetical protein
MSPFASVTDADLARGREDPKFRQKLVAESLELLLRALNKLNAATSSVDADGERQLREGADLAVQLAEMLHKIAERNSDPASAA